ncbi:hypothetical protein [Corynebacterium hindlerae]|uniref:hypothetical protein n=1 Tax=Corynebacterium hindlerae TaxID=699041 RepID=UPI0031B6DA41
MIRLAWRDIRKYWGRSLVAVLLFALPVTFFVSFFSVLSTSIYLDEHPENTLTYVQTDSPPGDGFSPVFRGYLEGASEGLSTKLWVTALPESAANEDLSIPPAGTIDLPVNPARAIGVDIGDTVNVGGVPVTVHDLHYHRNAIANISDFSSLDSNWWLVEHQPPTTYLQLFSADPMPPSLGNIIAHGLVTSVLFAPVWGIILILTSGLAAPIFTVAHARMRNTLDLLSCTGARRSAIRLLFLAEGLMLAALGVFLGLLSSWAISEATIQYLLGCSVRWDYHAGALFSAPMILAAAVASQLPLLGGQRRTPPRWVAIPGPVLLLGGIALIFTTAQWLVLGAMLIVMGGALCGLTAVTLLGWCAPRLPLLEAMAARDAFRHFRRSSAAIGAIVLTTLASTGIGLWASFFMEPDGVLTEGVLAAPNVQVTTPDGYAATLADLEADFGPRIDLYSAGPTDQQGYGGPWIDFGIGDVQLVTTPELLDRLNLPVEVRNQAKAKLAEGTPVSARELGMERPGELLTPDMASGHLIYRGSLFPNSPSAWQLVELQRLSQRSGMELTAANKSAVARAISGTTIAFCVVFVFAIVATILALTTFESRQDRQRLHDVGAGPRALRRYRICQLLMLALPGLAISALASLLMWWASLL